MTPYWNACTRSDTTSGAARLSVFKSPALDTAMTKAMAASCKQHYVDLAWLGVFGRKSLAAKLATVLPSTKTQKSGDLGEILATEFINWNNWPYKVLILRLRWKDGRDLALRGDDVIGFDLSVAPFGLLKAESKSRVSLKSADLLDAATALKKNAGRPSAFSVSYIVQRLFESGQKVLAVRIDRDTSGAALLTARDLAHLLFVFSGSDPTGLLTSHFAGSKKGRVKQYGVALHCSNHQSTIAAVYKEAGRG